MKIMRANLPDPRSSASNSDFDFNSRAKFIYPAKKENKNE
jgi:hypothetical protein